MGGKSLWTSKPVAVIKRRVAVDGKLKMNRLCYGCRTMIIMMNGD